MHLYLDARCLHNSVVLMRQNLINPCANVAIRRCLHTHYDPFWQAKYVDKPCEIVLAFGKKVKSFNDFRIEPTLSHVLQTELSCGCCHKSPCKTWISVVTMCCQQPLFYRRKDESISNINEWRIPTNYSRRHGFKRLVRRSCFTSNHARQKNISNGCGKSGIWICRRHDESSQWK